MANRTTSTDSKEPDEIAKQTRAIAANPGDRWAYYRRGTGYDQRNELDKANADFRRALELFSRELERDPNNADVLGKLARIHLTGPVIVKDLDQALLYAERAVALKPQDPDAIYTRGMALYRLGRITEAAAAFEKVCQLAPRGPESHELYFLAMYRHRLGDADQARELFGKAVNWWESQTNPLPHYRWELQPLRKEAEETLWIKD